MAKERKTKRREGHEIEFSRIVAFSDGVFAIAITLLVLAINIPDELPDESLGDALWGQRQDMLAYALSFAVIGRFWLVHHRFFSEVTAFDGRLLVLTCSTWPGSSSSPSAARCLETTGERRLRSSSTRRT